MTQESINKTIVVTYDDIARMKDFCCANEDGIVTREFMDWYVNENSFFSKTGMLVVENMFKETDNKFVVAFDFNNPDYPEFSIYDYFTQKPLCKCYFSREENLAMKDISVETKWIDMRSFISQKSVFTSSEINADIKKFKYRTGQPKNHLSKKKLQSEKNFLEKWLGEIYARTAIYMLEQGVYFCYATMYYFAKNKPKEIIGIPKNELLENGIGEQIKAIYKYTGYVNINDAKIYKPVIKKDKNEPTREYGRHIERWSVRGHYRRVKGKIIWIESFEKGHGELEKRIYGTQPESEVNLVPKVFEVMRTKPESKLDVEEIKSTTKEIISNATKEDFEQWEKSDAVKTTPPPIKRKPNIKERIIVNIKSAWTKIVSLFNHAKA